MNHESLVHDGRGVDELTAMSCEPLREAVFFAISLIPGHLLQLSNPEDKDTHN